MTGSETTGKSTSARSRPLWLTAVASVFGGMVLVLSGLFFGPFSFDQGPRWHASVVAVRDALRDVVLRQPHVLVIGDPQAATEERTTLEHRLAKRGLHVRYTGDQSMSSWERKYVAVYWSIVGMVFDPPVG
ncbi:MAG: hypothetical protein OXU20_12810 [Myxococcales bacterium]|nr:hypothetical protein [Myxococcales bacterium]MDD9970672.1 hypothetical protein [Myxococcales bacterium]